MDIAAFTAAAPGHLVEISGTDPVAGPWRHSAFVPLPLGMEPPTLSVTTYMEVADARAALAALDATASRLPNPALFRQPTLRREAQSTSALEGTYAPLDKVLTADEDAPENPDMVEILNYVAMADMGFQRTGTGWPLTVATLAELQGVLMRNTPLEAVSARSGMVRL